MSKEHLYDLYQSILDTNEVRAIDIHNLTRSIKAGNAQLNFIECLNSALYFYKEQIRFSKEQPVYENEKTEEAKEN